MMTRKGVFIRLFAMAICLGMIFYACNSTDPEPAPTNPTNTYPTNNPSNTDPPSTGTSYTVTASPTGAETTKLTFKFASSVTIDKSDINITPVNTAYQVTKGTLKGSGDSYDLNVSISGDGFNGSFKCRVSIEKSGISSDDREVDFYRSEGLTDYTLNTPLTIDSAGNAKLKFTFLYNNVNLNYNDITITVPSGCYLNYQQSGFSGSAREYTLDLTYATPGDYKVKLSTQGVNTAEKTLTLTKQGSNPPQGGDGVVTAVQIKAVPNKYSVADGITEWTVEDGFPRQYEAVFTPSTANVSVTWTAVNDPNDRTIQLTPNGKYATVQFMKAGSSTTFPFIYVECSDAYKAWAQSSTITTVTKKVPTGFYMVPEVVSGVASGKGTYATVSTSSIMLYEGDTSVKLITGLTKGGSAGTNLTNDQTQKTVTKSGTNPDSFSVNSSSYIDPTTGLPLLQYIIKPETDKGSPGSGASGKFTLAAQNGGSASTDVNVTVIYQPITQIKASVYGENGVTLIGTEADWSSWGSTGTSTTKFAFGTNGSNNQSLILKIQTNGPFQTVTATSKDSVKASIIAITPKEDIVTQTFTLKKGTNFSSGEVVIEFTVKDARGKASTPDKFILVVTP